MLLKIKPPNSPHGWLLHLPFTASPHQKRKHSMSKFVRPSNILAMGAALVSSIILFFYAVPGWLGVGLFDTIAVSFYHLVTSE